MRRFVSRDGDPRRFWEIELRWSEYTVRSGVLGGEPQTRKKSFADAAAAARVVEEMVEEKRHEGFIEEGVEVEAEPEAPPAEPIAEPPPAAPPPPPTVAKPADPSILRRFEYVGGGSSKFWEVQVTGAQYTVRFGRIGTKGQEKSKTFPDAAAAVREAAVLIAEKTGKGYVEVGREGKAGAGEDGEDDEEQS